MFQAEARIDENTQGKEYVFLILETERNPEMLEGSECREVRVAAGKISRVEDDGIKEGSST